MTEAVHWIGPQTNHADDPVDLPVLECTEEIVTPSAPANSQQAEG